MNLMLMEQGGDAMSDLNNDISNRLTNIELGLGVNQGKLDFLILSVDRLSSMLSEMYNDFSKSREATQSMMDSILGSEVIDGLNLSEGFKEMGSDDDAIRGAADTIGGLTSTIRDLKKKLEGLDFKVK